MADLFPSLPLMPVAPRPAQTPRVSAGADAASIAKAARDFEAMAIVQLLQPMFETVQTDKGLFGGGAGEAAWRPMMVEQVAKQIAAHGGLGLAKPIEDALRRAQETARK